MKTNDLTETWNAALDAALATLPGGDIADPQEIADDMKKFDWEARVTAATDDPAPPPGLFSAP